MSLFKSKEWWMTVCGGSDESFDRRCLHVGPLFGSESKDAIIVASHAGYLRIFRVSSQWDADARMPTGYRTNDLVIETKLCDCIIDVKLGRFVSGSSDQKLAILSPTKLIVYNVILRKGAEEHGDHCELEIAYEHNLRKFPASMTVGAFGGVRGRDFICVQCLDGALYFYEQETQAFHQIFHERLLPEPIIYVSRNDVFVTSNPSWVIEFYRYQTIAESTRNREQNTEKILKPDWSYNIGEAIIDIEAVTLSSFEVGIVVLAERNLYCLKDSTAALKYAKRLDYRPVCFKPYVIEPDGKLMVMVIADTGTLMIYEGTTLKWSAQLPFEPVSMARANLQFLDSAIVVLSGEGHLQACYLGSEPSLFVAPPVHRRGYDYASAELELTELRKASRESKDDRLNNLTADTELILVVSVLPDLLPCNDRPTRSESTDEPEDANLERFMCKIEIELSTYSTISDVQVIIDVREPLTAHPRTHNISNLCDKQIFHSLVRLNEDLVPHTPDVLAIASYESDKGEIRVIEKSVRLPSRLFLRACPPEGGSSGFTVTIKSSDTLIGLSQLFPELASDLPPGKNALGLQHAESRNVVTVITSTVGNRYRVQSNDGVSMALVLRLLVDRLKDRTSAALSSSIGQSQLQLLHERVEAHYESRCAADAITMEINLLTAQLRNIERRLLKVVRARRSESCASNDLPLLLELTYESIQTKLSELLDARMKRERAAHELVCAVKLILILTELSGKDEKYKQFESAIGFEPQLRAQIDWEEIADVALIALLKSQKTTSGTVQDAHKSLTWNRFSSTKELSKLKKRLIHAIERIEAARGSGLTESARESEISKPQ